MKFGIQVLAVVLVLALGIVSCATSNDPVSTQPKTSRADEVANILIGQFSSQAQSEEDPQYFPISLRHIPIWTDRSDGPWLYVEQAFAARPLEPYRQRVYQLVETAEDIQSIVFELPGDVSRFVGATADEFASVKPDDLTIRDGCTVYLERVSATHYRGATRGSGCETTIRGATYATSEVDLQFGALETWDRGFDAQGKQAWGATAGPYRFERQ